MAAITTQGKEIEQQQKCRTNYACTYTYTSPSLYSRFIGLMCHECDVCKPFSCTSTSMEWRRLHLWAVKKCAILTTCMCLMCILRCGRSAAQILAMLSHTSHVFYLDAMGWMSLSMVRKIADTYMWRNCTFRVAWDFKRAPSCVFHIFFSSTSAPSLSATSLGIIQNGYVCVCCVCHYFLMYFSRIRFCHLQFERHTKHLL